MARPWFKQLNSHDTIMKKLREEGGLELMKAFDIFLEHAQETEQLPDVDAETFKNLLGWNKRKAEKYGPLFGKLLEISVKQIERNCKKLSNKSEVSEIFHECLAEDSESLSKELQNSKQSFTEFSESLTKLEGVKPPIDENSGSGSLYRKEEIRKEHKEDNSSLLRKEEGESAREPSSSPPPPVFEKNVENEAERRLDERRDRLLGKITHEINGLGKPFPPDFFAGLKTWIEEGMKPRLHPETGEKEPDFPDQAFVYAGTRLKRQLKTNAHKGLDYLRQVFVGSLGEYTPEEPGAMGNSPPSPFIKPYHERLIEAGVAHDAARLREYNMTEMVYMPGNPGQHRSGRFTRQGEEDVPESWLTVGPLPDEVKAQLAANELARGEQSLVTTG